jgi:5-methylthioribose kinase
MLSCHIRNAEVEPRTQQRRWLLECLQQLWAGFQQRFTALWREHGAGGDACSAALFDGSTAEVRSTCCGHQHERLRTAAVEWVDGCCCGS